MHGRPFDPATGLYHAPPSTAPDPEAPKAWRRCIGWHVLLAADLLALGGLVVYSVVWGGGDAVVTRTGLLAATALSVLCMGAIPFLWVVGTRQGGLHGAKHYLRLEHPAVAIPRGLLLGVALYLGLVLLAVALTGLHVPTDNPKGQAIGHAVDLPLALVVALGAGASEEILFRGVLQRWVGVWGQAALFGLAHLDYGTPLQVVVPVALGLLFGYLVKRGSRLWVPIAAHFTFDFIQLALAAVAR
ncbi:MAG: lysostaphin resistance A-like protein [Thermoplasmatota archaeon]